METPQPQAHPCPPLRLQHPGPRSLPGTRLRAPSRSLSATHLPMKEPRLQMRLKKQLSGGRVPHLLWGQGTAGAALSRGHQGAGPSPGHPEHPLLVPIPPRGSPLPLRAPGEARGWVRPGPQPTHQLLTSRGGCDPACSRSRGHPRRTTGCNSCGEQRDGLGGPAAGQHRPRGGITPWVPTGSPGAGAGTRSSQPWRTQPRAGSAGGTGHTATGSSGLAGNVAPGWETGPRGTGTPQRPPRLAPGPLHVPLVPSMPPPGCCLGE